MFGSADEGGEVAFWEIFAREAGSYGAATVIDHYRGVVKGFCHCCGGEMVLRQGARMDAVYSRAVCCISVE